MIEPSHIFLLQAEASNESICNVLDAAEWRFPGM